MAKLLLYYAHPGHRKSHANKTMFRAARDVEGISCVDLYRAYPRFDINVETEQQRLSDHDVILFQFPVFWYSSPAIIKEWQDLVLEHGFAYGAGGDHLEGKRMMLALTAAGPEEAYSKTGYQNHALRDFLTPFEQTATLCKMQFEAPYVLFGSLRAPEEGTLAPHVDGYTRLLNAIRTDAYDFDGARKLPQVTAATLPLPQEA